MHQPKAALVDPQELVILKSLFTILNIFVCRIVFMYVNCSWNPSPALSGLHWLKVVILGFILIFKTQCLITVAQRSQPGTG